VTDDAQSKEPWPDRFRRYLLLLAKMQLDDPGDSRLPMIATEVISLLERRECCETAME
jgi:hypothetical protein